MESLKRFSIIRLTALMLFLVPASALAATVNNTNNAGVGSLRDAVATTPPGGTVDFDPSLAGSTIVLSTQIVINKNLTIAGPGPGQVTVSGNNVTRIFNITGGNEVAISGLRFINGFVTGGGLQLGSAIINQGAFNLTIDNCVFESNNASCNSVGCVTGGAVTQAISGGALLNVSDSVFRFNRASCSGNSCIALGAALANGSGGDVDITVNNSTFFRNTVSADCQMDCLALGAGYGNGGGGSDVRSLLFNSTFESNSASCSGEACLVIGSGVSNGGGDTFFQLINNTLYANGATCSGDNCFALGAGFGNGGGGVTADLLFNTFSSNSVTCTGSSCSASGASISSSASQINIDSNILFTDSPADNCDEIFTSLGYNIDNDGTCVDGSVAGDQPFTDPGLVPGPPQDNGGLTRTLALLVNSPAVNAGDPACPPPDTDQRGVTRPQRISCDVGSYELEAFAAARPIPTLSEWGMISAALGLGLVGVLFVFRKRKAQAV